MPIRKQSARDFIDRYSTDLIPEYENTYGRIFESFFTIHHSERKLKLEYSEIEGIVIEKGQSLWWNYSLLALSLALCVIGILANVALYMKYALYAAMVILFVIANIINTEVHIMMISYKDRVVRTRIPQKLLYEANIIRIKAIIKINRYANY